MDRTRSNRTTSFAGLWDFSGSTYSMRLSKILVQADVNNNLMLLEKSRYVDLWVKLFEKVVNSLQETETNENPRQGLQSAKFPFSGKVSKMIHDTIKKQIHHGMEGY